MLTAQTRKPKETGTGESISHHLWLHVLHSTFYSRSLSSSLPACSIQLGVKFMRTLLILFSRITFADKWVAGIRAGYATDAKLIVTSSMVRPYLNALVVKECSLRTREKLLKITLISARPKLANIQEKYFCFKVFDYRLFTSNLVMLKSCDLMDAHSSRLIVLKGFVMYTKNSFELFSACRNIPISLYILEHDNCVSGVYDCIFSCNLYHFQKGNFRVINKQKVNKLKTTLRNSSSNNFLKTVHFYLNHLLRFYSCSYILCNYSQLETKLQKQI